MGQTVFCPEFASYLYETLPVQERNKVFAAFQNQQAEIKIAATVNNLKAGGVIENITITLYNENHQKKEYSVFNLLFNRYQIAVPIKVKGWIAKNLLSVNVRNGYLTGNRHVGQSVNIYCYFNQLLLVLRQKSAMEEIIS